MNVFYLLSMHLTIFFSLGPPQKHQYTKIINIKKEMANQGKSTSSSFIRIRMRFVVRIKRKITKKNIRVPPRIGTQKPACFIYENPDHIETTDINTRQIVTIPDVPIKHQSNIFFMETGSCVII